MTVMTYGTDMIAAERQRQIDGEGWSTDHDDEHTACEMTMAGVAYAHYAVGQINGVEWPEDDDRHPAIGWPWHLDWWKPSPNPIRNLEKAGALIAAEIDRLERLTIPRHGRCARPVGDGYCGIALTPQITPQFRLLVCSTHGQIAIIPFTGETPDG